MGIFGNFFDFDGDGEASMFEEYLGLELLGFFDVDEEDDANEDDFFTDEDGENDSSEL